MLYASVNSSCAQSPPPGYCGAFARLVSPGGGAFAKFVLPRGRAFANPGAIPELWHARGFLSEYNYTEDFIGKEMRLAHLSRAGKNWRGLKRHVLDFMHAFLHCLSSQDYIAKSGAIKVNQRFWSLNQISVDIIWKASFHIYKTIHNI